MGLSMVSMLHLQKQGLLSPEKNRILDIGPQNVYYATVGQIREFLDRQGGPRSAGEELQKEIDRLVYFSTPRAGERTTFFSEIADLCNIDYRGIDVAPAPNTTLLDLNFESLPDEFQEYFDVVLNFGTTEHVFNQWNCFKSMHDALRVGGVMYCIVPMSGYVEHGYYCYTPLFFRDLAGANGYKLRDCFVVLAGTDDLETQKVEMRDDNLQPASDDIRPYQRVPCFNIHVVLQKQKQAPFKVALETNTSHAMVGERIAQSYVNGFMSSDAQSKFDDMLRKTEKLEEEVVKLEEKSRLMEESIQHLTRERDELSKEVSSLLSSNSWKVTAPLRLAAQWVRRG